MTGYTLRTKRVNGFERTDSLLSCGTCDVTKFCWRTDVHIVLKEDFEHRSHSCAAKRKTKRSTVGTEDKVHLEMFLCPMLTGLEEWSGHLFDALFIVDRPSPLKESS